MIYPNVIVLMYASRPLMRVPGARIGRVVNRGMPTMIAAFLSGVLLRLPRRVSLA